MPKLVQLLSLLLFAVTAACAHEPSTTGDVLEAASAQTGAEASVLAGNELRQLAKVYAYMDQIAQHVVGTQAMDAGDTVHIKHLLTQLRSAMKSEGASSTAIDAMLSTTLPATLFTALEEARQWLIKRSNTWNYAPLNDIYQAAAQQMQTRWELVGVKRLADLAGAASREESVGDNSASPQRLASGLVDAAPVRALAAVLGATYESTDLRARASALSRQWEARVATEMRIGNAVTAAIHHHVDQLIEQHGAPATLRQPLIDSFIANLLGTGIPPEIVGLALSH